MFVTVFLLTVTSVTANPLLQGLGLPQTCTCQEDPYPTLPSPLSLLLPNGNLYESLPYQNQPLLSNNNVNPTCQNPCSKKQLLLDLLQNQLSGANINIIPQFESQNQMPQKRQCCSPNYQTITMNSQNVPFYGQVTPMNGHNSQKLPMNNQNSQKLHMNNQNSQKLPMNSQNAFMNDNRGPMNSQQAAVRQNTHGNNPRQVNHAVADKVLNNDKIKIILNPSTKLYNQDGKEVPRDLCQPHVVNNYIIVPPELFMEECTNRNDDRERRNRKKNRSKTNNSNESDTSKESENQTVKSDNNGVIAEPKNDTIYNTQNFETNSNILHEYGNLPLNEITNHNATEESIKFTNAETKTDQNTPLTTTVKEISPFNEVIESQVEIPQTNTQVPSNYMSHNPYTSNYYPFVTNTNAASESNTNYNLFEQYTKLYNDMTHKNKAQEKTPTENNTQPSKEIHKGTNFEEKETGSVTKNNDIRTGNGRSKNNATITIRVKNNNRNQNPSNTHTMPYDPKEEFMMREFRNKFPNVREGVVRHLMREVNKHLQEEQIRPPQYPYPMYPMNFGQFYGPPYFGNTYGNSPNYCINCRRNNRRHRNGNKKVDVKNNNENFEIIISPNSADVIIIDDEWTSTSTNVCKNDSANQQNEVNKIEEIKTQVEPAVNTPTDKSKSNKNQQTVVMKEGEDKQTSTKEQEIGDISKNEVNQNKVKPGISIVSMRVTENNSIASSTTNNKIVKETKLRDDNEVVAPELGTEEEVPIMYSNSMNDYYPDFTADNHAYFLKSMEDNSLKHLQDDRYHYTTDRTEELGNNKKKNKIDKPNTSDGIKSNSVVKTAENATKRDNNPQSQVKEESKEKEIQYKPPVLDNPDFETKRVDVHSEALISKKQNKDKNTTNDKISTYSTTKTPRYSIKDKPSKSDAEKPRDETVTLFGNSKVIKYGGNEAGKDSVANSNPEKEAKESTKDGKIMKGDATDTPDEDKFVVFAQSIPEEMW